MCFGDDYQRLTKHNRQTLRGRELDWENMPESYKRYPAELQRFELPKPDLSDGGPLFQVMARRRSVRSFAGRALAAKLLSQLLWAAQGITLNTGPYQFRTAPSAGALYPVETYVLVNRVDGFEPGIYHYGVQEHVLTLLREGDFSRVLARAVLGQGMVEKAAVVFAWSALVRRGTWKYEQRAYRYFYLDAGHIAQNVALAAVSLGLGSCQIGAYFDDEVNAVLQLDGEKETALYLTALGHLPE